MVGLIKRVTKNFQLQIPNYDVPGWGFALNKNFDLIDSLIFSITGISDVQGEWLNNTAYVVGDRVIDPDTGGIYQANTAHVSPSTGTFAADRAANPTRWSILLSPFAFRGVWTTGVEYRLNEFLYSGHRYGVATQTYTSGASYDADVAAGKIITLADLTASVTAAANSATASANSATAANNSAIAAAASAAAAATFDPANFYTKVQADGRYVQLTGNQSISGTKTFQQTIAVAAANGGLEVGVPGTASTPFIDFHSSANVNDFDVRIIASGGAAGTGAGLLTINASALVVGGATYQADGNIQFTGGMSSGYGATLATALSNRALLTGATFTGDVYANHLVSTGAVGISIQNAGARHLWFRSDVGVQRGLLYHDHTGNAMRTHVYDGSGAFQKDIVLFGSGLLTTSAHRFDIGTHGIGSAELRWTADGNSGFRIIYDGADGLYFQKSTDLVNYGAAFLQFNAANEATFSSNVYGYTFQSTSNGAGTNIKIGDDAWLGDINQGNTVAVRGVSNFNSGFLCFGSSTNKLGIDSTLSTDALRWGASGYYLQSDGNQYLPMFGDTLYNVMNQKAPLVPAAINSIGSYIMAKRVSGTGAGPGGNDSGSDLVYANTSSATGGSGVGSGTFRNHGTVASTTVASTYERIA